MNKLQNLKTYSFHGVKIDPECNGEAIASCPFCGGDKFYINTGTGQFCCKHENKCGKSGNKYTFLQYLYEDALETTDSKHYRKLSKLRNLPSFAFKSAKLAYDDGMGRWLIPVRNEKDSIVNLRVWDPEEKVPMNTAGCKTHLGGLEHLDNSSLVYICEGEWDAIALRWLLKKNKKVAAVLFAPGAGTFKEEWAEKFKNKDVVLLYDNDAAGKRGQSRTLSFLQKSRVCKSIRTIKWADNHPDKYDISDLVSVHQEKPSVCYKLLNDLLKDEETIVKRKPKSSSCTSFGKLIKHFKKHIFLSPDAEDALLLACASVLSNKISGEPIWLFIVGPPGGGKTLLLQSFGQCIDTHYESNLSAKTLVSGYKTQDGSDPSLLPRIIGKTLILKDFTEVMSKPIGEVEEIFGQLRGAYDGHVSRSYATGIVRVYPEPGSPHDNCRFSVLAGVTNKIHGYNLSDLGERFIKFQMVNEGYNPVDQVRQAIDNTIKQRIPEEDLQDVATSFLNHLCTTCSPKKLPTVPEWFIERIVGLSQLVGVVRANVERKGGVLTYRPAPEVGTRLSKQLIKLAQSVSLVLGDKEVSKEVYSLISRVAIDTCFGWHRDVVLALVANKDRRGPIQRMDIARVTEMAPTTAARVLDDLIELRAVKFDLIETKNQGQPPRSWHLTDELLELIELAGLEETPHINQMLDSFKLPEPKRKKFRRVNK